MTPTEAYDIIHKATGVIALDRASHEMLEAALKVIRTLVLEAKKE